MLLLLGGMATIKPGMQGFIQNFTLGGGGGGNSHPCMRLLGRSGGMPAENCRFVCSLRLILMPFLGQIYGPRNSADY